MKTARRKLDFGESSRNMPATTASVNTQVISQTHRPGRYIKPYQYEPKKDKPPVQDSVLLSAIQDEISAHVSSDEDENTEQSIQSSDSTRPKWCKCGECEEMSKQEECLCCYQIMDEFDECLTYNEEFLTACTNHSALKIGMIYDAKSRKKSRPTGIEDAVNEKQLRFAAYRNFVAWFYGYRGKGRRTPLPSCVVIKIRSLFPGDKKYVGFLGKFM